MKAAIFYGPNDVRIETIDLDNRSNDAILLKTLSCSVCSYDVRTYRNGSFKVTPPIILGHEICAETISEYRGKNFSINSNSRVTIYPIIPCFDCWFCINKKFNLCSNLREIGSTMDGGFAEYIKVPKQVFEIGGIVPVPEEVSNEEASLIEPLACCINGINQIRHSEFESAVIIGDGPIGMMQLMLLKKIFYDLNITMIGKINHRLEAAKKLGADRAIVIKEDLDEEIIYSLKEIRGQKSPNLIFVSNNNPNSLNLALRLVNKGGEIVIFSGIKKVEDAKSTILMSIDPNKLHYDQVSIHGSFSSNPSDLKEAMSLVKNSEIKLKGLVTHLFSLEEFREALTATESFTGFKSIINEF